MTKRGLCLVVGGTGSGKSTTLAAMIGYRNENSSRPHHHDRRSGRVRASASRLRRHASRGRRRHGQLAQRAEEHAAPSARRHHDRRDPRSGHDELRDPVRRDRPPVRRYAAREQREPGARPHHQLLPGGAAPSAAHGPVAEHYGDDLAAAVAAREQDGPHCRDGDHARVAVDQRPHLPRRSRNDQRHHGEVHASRHADVRPGVVPAVRGRRHLVRGGDAQRRLEERAPAQDQAAEQARGRRPQRSTPRACSWRKRRRQAASRRPSQRLLLA